MSTKIVVTIEGGCLRSVYCSDPEAKIRLLDADNIEDDEDEPDFDTQLEEAIDGLTEVF